jgi:RNA polymerase sigma factor (sigma-70 family)
MSAKSDSQSTHFSLTDWSMVNAVCGSDADKAQRALEAVCRRYRYPLYAYLRRRGHGPEDAEDLVQQFFESRIMNKRVFEGVAPGSGRFRSWLLTCLSNMVSNERARQQAVRRGGRAKYVPLDIIDAESRYASENAAELTPETLYDRSWVATLVDGAMEELAGEYRAAGRGELFEALKGHLPGPHQARSYAEISERLNVQENNLRAEVSKLRKRCGEHMIAQIRQTVNHPAEAREELRYLMSLISA